MDFLNFWGAFYPWLEFSVFFLKIYFQIFLVASDASDSTSDSFFLINSRCRSGRLLEYVFPELKRSIETIFKLLV